MSKVARFEIRSTRTGKLEDAYAGAEHAIAFATTLRIECGEAFFIVDLGLPVVENDPRIVWLDAPPLPAALARAKGQSGRVQYATRQATP